MKKLLASLTMVALLAGCAQNSNGLAREDGRVSKQNVGAIAGAIGGGVLGSNVGKGKGAIAGTIIGTLLGAGLGSEIGASLDRADMAYYNNTSQQALETVPDGRASTWKNPNSGNYGTVTPTKTYESDGQYCREYSQSITVGGKTQNGYGHACRQPDGNWKIVD